MFQETCIVQLPDLCLHSLSTFIFALGKRWADGGLRDLLVDSDVYAGNTVEQILTGKQFNRDIRGFTFLFYSLIIYIAAIIHWWLARPHTVA
jgi:hypothetical protein